MPVIANQNAREIPWRPGYRNFVIAGRDEGMSTVTGYSVLQPGAGAPLHAHKDADEIFIVLEGTLEYSAWRRTPSGPCGSHHCDSGRCPAHLYRRRTRAGPHVHLHAGQRRDRRRHDLFRGWPAAGRGAALSPERFPPKWKPVRRRKRDQPIRSSASARRARLPASPSARFPRPIPSAG